MTFERPDLSQVDPVILSYIETLEAELIQLRENSLSRRRSVPAEPAEPSEPPTTVCLVSIS